MDLLVKAEPVDKYMRYEDTLDGFIYGYVCCCKDCREPLPSFYYKNETDKKRPVGLLTGYDGIYGNTKVFTDTMEFATEDEYIEFTNRIRKNKEENNNV